MNEFTPPATALQDAVRALTGSATARVRSWRRSPVDWRVVSEVTGGLHRLSGTLEDGGDVKPWSLVVKVNHRPPGYDKADEAEGRREEFAYTTGILRPRGGFAIARCLAVTQPLDQETWLWLEDVPDEGGALWGPERHASAARHLGVFNGSHMLGSSAEAPAWLLRGWLEQLQPLADDEDSERLRHEDVWRHPPVRLAFPEPVLDQLARLSQSAPRLRQEVSSMSQSLCHLDPGQFNLCSRTGRDGTIETVFLDWQALSSGPLGTDLAMMNVLNLFRLYIHPEEAKSYSDATLAAYLEGLHEGGSDVDPEPVQRTYTALAALRAGAIIRILVNALVMDEGKQTWVVQWGKRQGLSRDEALRAWGQNMQFLLDLFLVRHERGALAKP
jgi:hypothetical protein